MESQGQFDRRTFDEYLGRGQLMSLSTTDGDGLFMCSVWYAASDEQLRLVFTSRDSRRHSDHIRSNGKVAGSIVALDLTGLGQKTQGIFFRGIAEEAAGEKLEWAYRIYAQRWPQVENMFTLPDILKGSTKMRMYIVRVDEFTFVDEIGSPEDPIMRILPNDLATTRMP